jgi:hypothetical protein
LAGSGQSIASTALVSTPIVSSSALLEAGCYGTMVCSLVPSHLPMYLILRIYNSGALSVLISWILLWNHSLPFPERFECVGRLRSEVPRSPASVIVHDDAHIFPPTRPTHQTWDRLCLYGPAPGNSLAYPRRLPHHPTSRYH